MPTYKLNWINKIHIKSSKNASNNMGQNLSRKLAIAKRIFHPDLAMSRNSEKNSGIQRMKSCSYSNYMRSFRVTV